MKKAPSSRTLTQCLNLLRHCTIIYDSVFPPHSSLLPSLLRSLPPLTQSFGCRFAPPRFAPPRFAPPRFAPPHFAPPHFAPPRFAPPRFTPSLLQDTLLTNELVYWQSAITDPNCFAIIELVATEVSKSTKVVSGQYGCGWSLLQPFGDVSLKDVTNMDTSEDGYLPLKIYGGTPRKLRFLTKNDYYRLDEIAIVGCKVRYKLNTHTKLTKLLKDSNLFPENELVGASDIVAGLETNKIRYPDDRGTFKGAIIGGDASGSKKSWNFAPELHPKLAPKLNLLFKNLTVMIPERDTYERNLITSLNAQIPEEEVFKEEVSFRLSSSPPC